MYCDIQVKCPLLLSHLNETCTFSTEFRKSPDIKFHKKNPSSGSGVVPRGETDEERERVRERQTDMTRIIVAFRGPR